MGSYIPLESEKYYESIVSKIEKIKKIYFFNLGLIKTLLNLNIFSNRHKNMGSYIPLESEKYYESILSKIEKK